STGAVTCAKPCGANVPTDVSTNVPTRNAGASGDDPGDHRAMDRPRLAAMTPQRAARGAAGSLPDADLPMLAAEWLAQGFDSEPLRELAGLSRNDGAEARRLLPVALESLGHPIRELTFPYDELPWRGYWNQIAWAQDVMDDLLS